MANRYFTEETLSFLRQLAGNNRRDWFEEHKSDYEVMVRQPALQFITDMADDLATLTPHFLAQAKKVGGSLMRIHRDVRFGTDKRPYKTNIGIQFRHENGKDVHAPGFYLHIEPDEFFVGVGIWRPDSTALGKIRDVIAEQPGKWQRAIGGKSFQRHFVLSGESLKQPPRGYDKEHPLMEDLKRKDHIAVAALKAKEVTGREFKKLVFERFLAANDYMDFLCKALGLRY